MRNPFRAPWVASRYAVARPNIHTQILDHVRRTVPENELGGIGLDVGCGAGLSAVALAEVTSRVVAVDTSAEMLAHAREHSCVTYVQSLAEELPFRSATFDISTVGCTFHWCHPVKLLDELYRVLRSAGWLVIYDNGFMGPTEAFPEFERWHRAVYQRRYPAPPRHPQFHPFKTVTTGFRVFASEFLQEAVPFTVSKLATYLTTQSNVVAAVEAGKEGVEEVESWLADELTSIFKSAPGCQAEATRDFTFGGYVSYLRAVK